MKAFTNIEQSKKLAKILPIESADMCFNDNEPCWSLVALLGVVSEVSLNSFKDGNWNAMVLQNGKIIYGNAGNPIDACYEMILKLHEQKLI